MTNALRNPVKWHRRRNVRYFALTLLVLLTLWGIHMLAKHRFQGNASEEWAIVSAIGTVVGAVFVFSQLHNEWMLHRSELTFQIVGEWDEKMWNYRKVLDEHLGPYWNDREPVSVPIRLNVQREGKVVEIRFGDLCPQDDPQRYQLKEAVIHIMNFMENVGWLWKHDQIDREMLVDLLGSPMKTTYEFLRDYRLELSQAVLNNKKMPPENPSHRDRSRDDAWPDLRQFMDQIPLDRHWPRATAAK